MTTAAATNIHETSREQGFELFDSEVQRRLGISGDEFLERWDAGEYRDQDTPDVVSVAMLIPFAR